MRAKKSLTWLVFISIFLGFTAQPALALAPQAGSERQVNPDVSAYDLIAAMNSLRVSNGLPALVEDPIIDAVAQSTAQIMADSQMSWHIGNVSGRIASAGYGGGAKVWATENFAMGTMGIDEIMQVWADPDHMLPAVIAAYCNVGAGTAKAANGMTYYILQAAYVSGKACGEYTSSGTTNSQTGSTTGGGAGGISQLVVPVKIATPDADGKIFHVVQSGQSFWSIAIAYKITIKDLKKWNNLSDAAVLKIGEKLFIPGSNTAGYATPTQVGAFQLSTPDVDGGITHTVAPYQTLTSIALAYGTTVKELLTLNGIQADWPLRIGQKLVVRASNITPSPTLQPVQMLTPASDGKYYHIVKSGETLLWIAGRYGVKLGDLMAWNGLSTSSIIRLDQKLLLLVTPPATSTATLAPVTITPQMPTASPTQPPATMTITATPPSPSFGGDSPPLAVGGLVVVILAVIFGAVTAFRRKQQGGA